MRDRITVWLGVVGVLVVVVGAVLTVLALRPDGVPAERPAAAVATNRFVSAKGGWSVRVPVGMTAKHLGRSGRFTTRDKQLVITVGPAGRGTLAASRGRLVDGLRSSYPKVDVLGSRRQTLDGRRAVATYGTARTAKGVRVRFVALVVRAASRNDAITTFAAASSDPRRVLRLVDTLEGSFQVLPAPAG
jgi:hypothetical protein